MASTKLYVNAAVLSSFLLILLKGWSLDANLCEECEGWRIKPNGSESWFNVKYEFCSFCCDELNYWLQIVTPLELFPTCAPLLWPHDAPSKLFQPLTLGLTLWLALAIEMLVEMTWAHASNSLCRWVCHLCLCHHHEKKISWVAPVFGLHK